MKNLFKNIIHNFGFDIVKYYPEPLERARAINSQQKGAKFIKILTFNEIDLVLDVGANTGQFASHLFEIGYQGKVVSFEPLSSAYDQLLEKSKSNSRWQIASQCAIGDSNGEIEINIANNSESSSILPMLEAHLDAAPRSAYIGSEKVPIVKLNDIADQYINDYHNILLKIDTQGYEYQVLKGAEKILPKLKGIHLELSLVPLYEGQPSFDFMLAFLEDQGFALYSLSPGFWDYRTGRLLQVMGTFMKE